MLLVVLAAGALLVGVPTVIVAGVLVISFLPFPVVVAGVLVASVVSVSLHRRGRGGRSQDEGEVLRQISGRVSAGSTIRSTIADPTIDTVPVHARRLAALGRPMAEVGEALAPTLPINGAAFRAICSFSEHTGAAISSALVVLADRADEATEIARQRRVSLAQVKLSAVVVGLVPIAVSIALVVFRGIPSPGGALIVVPMIVGVSLEIVGTAIVFRVASRAN
jgi:Flp pilus assembly protein TadB